MKVFAVYTILCYWICHVYSARKLVDYVNICKRTDPNISKCWHENTLNLRPYLIKGIPEFNLPPMEPLVIEQLHFDQRNTRVGNFTADVTKLTIHGGGAYEVPYTHADVLKTLSVNQGFKFPQLTAVGDYKAKGQVVSREFDGAGQFSTNLTDVKINATWFFKIINKKSKEYFIVDRVDMQVDVDKIVVYVDGLFPGNPQLTKNVNNAINENIDTLYKDFQPLVITIVSNISKQYLNRVFNRYPYHVLLPVD